MHLSSDGPRPDIFRAFIRPVLIYPNSQGYGPLIANRIVWRVRSQKIKQYAAQPAGNDRNQDAVLWRANERDAPGMSQTTDLNPLAGPGDVLPHVVGADLHLCHSPASVENVHASLPMRCRGVVSVLAPCYRGFCLAIF